MPLAWRGLAGCLVRRPVAVVCVCSACGGGRIATRELACGERRGEKGESCHRVFHSFADPSLEKSGLNPPGWRWDSDTTSHMLGFMKGFLQGGKKTCFVSETTGLFLERVVFIPRTFPSPLPSGGRGPSHYGDDWEKPANLPVFGRKPWLHTGKPITSQPIVGQIHKTIQNCLKSHICAFWKPHVSLLCFSVGVNEFLQSGLVRFHTARYVDMTAICGRST